ncbi:hypothetical protein [Rhizobium sp. AAP43]|uniref:hypothetical protein n=1 Tax=Rhizobium sp. AAP43 TaxID=1523420 RepID=UPI0006B9C718|nr:hypothetical protein [Rhizobium sp. AAP43]KPF43034.1 hypothetical protein IP76_14680 [Rhizobium sp. AAP43]
MTDTKPAMITTLIENWKLHSAEAKQRLRLQYVPFQPTPEMIDRVEAFLHMSEDEQQQVIEACDSDDAELWISVLTARAIYEERQNKGDGSITEERVARYPERYP